MHPIFCCIFVRFSHVLGQALLLDGIVSDTAGLIKQTGIFYDLYSATHRENTAATTDGHRLFINSKPNTAENTPTATEREWAKRRVEGGARPEENARNFLGRTVEAGGVDAAAGGAGAGGAGAKELQELDKRCYSLLDSNAQLCLRLQELGLDYTGLARQLANEDREVNICFWVGAYSEEHVAQTLWMPIRSKCYKRTSSSPHTV